MEPADSQPAWEAAKENIQPLKRGRNIASLTEALQNPELLEETKREFEEDLRAYEGDDPLNVWDNYLTWIEEHYPSGLHRLHLPQLLENCIFHFMSETKYDNDPRYVRVWLKFASSQANPEEVYKCMSARGVGIRCTLFYTEWAEYHELSGEPRRAQEILEKGYQMLAEPRDQLKNALKQLILRISQGSTRPQEEHDAAGQGDSEMRSAFSKLRTGSTQKVPSLRVGANRITTQPGAIQGLGAKSGSRNNKMTIFVDENVSTDLFVAMGSQAGTSSRAHSSTSVKENVKKTKSVDRSKIKQRIQAHERPTFEIVQDLDATNRTPAKATSLVGILSSRKDTSTQMILSNVLEPNISEKRAYDFFKLYAGTTEFQFEEIRLAKYKRKLGQRTLSGSSERKNISVSLSRSPSSDVELPSPISDKNLTVDS